MIYALGQAVPHVPDSVAYAVKLLNEARGVTDLVLEPVAGERIERLRKDLLGELERP